MVILGTMCHAIIATTLLALQVECSRYETNTAGNIHTNIPTVAIFPHRITIMTCHIKGTKQVNVLKQDITYYMRKYGSPPRIRSPVSCVQGRRDNHYTTGEPTVTADEIAHILITSL